MAARSFLGAGDVYIDRVVEGVSQGLVGPIYANKLSIQPNVEKKESTSKGRYDYGQVLESVNLQQPAELSLELKEATGDILTMAFLGTSAALSAASGTMTDQARVITAVGRWYPLGHLNLADTITVETLATGGVVLVEGTDYRLNRPLGLIMALAGGAIDAADTVYVTGAYDGATGTVVSGATRTEVRCRILFDGINQADGTQVTVDIFEAVLSADSEFDFLADDFGVVSLTGTLKTPTGQTAPFTVTVQDAVA
jgi:hypothetical protein